VALLDASPLLKNDLDTDFGLGFRSPTNNEMHETELDEIGPSLFL
jgi:hypothetical protein